MTLHYCASCGFISTDGSGYVRKTPEVEICTYCDEDHKAGVQPVARWVDEALNSKKGAA